MKINNGHSLESITPVTEPGIEKGTGEKWIEID